MMLTDTRRCLQTVLTCAALVASSWSQADDFKAFTADSFAQIRQQFAGQEFLVGLWSIDCPPCLVELQYMGELIRLNPDLPYVLISTDPIAESDYAREFLEDFALTDVDAWMFADSFVERLRFTIDPSWYGELPRSYFFDAGHQMQAHSGIVNRELLDAWFQRELTFP